MSQHVALNPYACEHVIISIVLIEKAIWRRKSLSGLQILIIVHLSDLFLTLLILACPLNSLECVCLILLSYSVYVEVKECLTRLSVKQFS